MENTLSIQEKSKLIVLLRDMLSEQRTIDANEEASVQLEANIQSLIDTLNTKDVDFLYAADYVAQITNIYYLLEDYEHALATCEISFDYYKRYEEISDEIVDGLTHTYWNYYCLLKLCNRDKKTLISANKKTKARIEKYYHENENQRKALIDELDDDWFSYASFVDFFKELFKKYRKYFIISYSIAILWLVINAVFYLIAHNSIYTAINIYLYDGSSVINHYTKLEIHNDNYKKGELFRQENKYLDAIPYFEKALSELQNEHSEDDLIIAQTRMHLGVSYLSVDNMTAAHEQFSNAYVAYKNVLGDDNDNTNEARLYWAVTNQMESNYETAIGDATDAFERMNYFGAKQEVCYYLCDFFKRKGDYKHALEWNDRFLGYIDSIVGPRLNNFVYIRKADGEILRGSIFYYARELENSDECYESALKDLENAEKAPGKDDFTLTINQLRFKAYQSLSEVKSGLGDDESAKDLFAKALACYDNAGGNDYDSLYLSSVNAYKNNSSELPQILLNNLDQTIAINDENNIYTVQQLLILSEYYLQERDYNNALAVNERALDIQKNLLAEETPDSLDIYNNLAACCIALEDYEQAENWAMEGLRISTEIYGYKAQRTKPYVVKMIVCMNKTKQYEKALTIIELCITIGIPDSTFNSQELWEDLEKRYIEKVGDAEAVTACVDNAEKLSKTMNEGNFCSVIKMIIGD